MTKNIPEEEKIQTHKAPKQEGERLAPRDLVGLILFTCLMVCMACFCINDGEICAAMGALGLGILSTWCCIYDVAERTQSRFLFIICGAILIGFVVVVVIGAAFAPKEAHFMTHTVTALSFFVAFAFFAHFLSEIRNEGFTEKTKQSLKGAVIFAAIGTALCLSVYINNFISI